MSVTTNQITGVFQMTNTITTTYQTEVMINQRLNKGTPDYKSNHKLMPKSAMSKALADQRKKFASNDTCKVYFNADFKR